MDVYFNLIQYNTLLYLPKVWIGWDTAMKIALRRRFALGKLPRGNFQNLEYKAYI